MCCFFFFFNDTATTEIYTLSLHDALPISLLARNVSQMLVASLSTQHDPLFVDMGMDWRVLGFTTALRSEEHTSELQSQSNLVCRLLLEKKKQEMSTANNNNAMISVCCFLI